MHIVVKAGSEQKKEFLKKHLPHNCTVSWMQDEHIDADLYFDLTFEEEGNTFAQVRNKLVFVNAVIATCSELPSNFIRINAWNGFFERGILEIAATDTRTRGRAEEVLNELEWKFQWVPDEPGMISARIISMIINEAYFGLGDEISSKEGIDTAMKLGTNYPYGPFEWADKIGLYKIFSLLKKLNEKDERYAIAPRLEKEIIKQ